MKSTVYHFFAELLKRRGYLPQFVNLEDFDFPENLIVARTKGSFPDIVLRRDDSAELQGGEFIKLKTAKTYSIPSFNSTLPSAKKPMSSLSQKLRDALVLEGEEIMLEDFRDVYYLLVGRNMKALPAPRTKVCLVHGSFFETLPIRSVLIQAAKEALNSYERDNTVDLDRLFDSETDEAIKARFSSTRTIEGSAIKLRFRVMAEVHSEANLMNSSKFSFIKDDSISMILKHAESFVIDSEKLYTIEEVPNYISDDPSYQNVLTAI